MPALYSFIIFISSLLAPLGVDASFTHNLSFRGVQSAAHVTELQQFLKDEGLFSGEASGNFYTQTYLSLVAFQKREGITPASGYFGPLTRARANTILAGGTGDWIADSGTTGQTASAYNASSSSRASILAQIDKLWAELRSRQKTAATPASSNSASTGSVASTPTSSTSNAAASSTKKTSTKPATSSGSSTSSSSSGATNTSLPTSSGSLAWGVYAGDSMSALSSVESIVGKTASMQAIFWGWDDTFPTEFNLAAGKTLVIYWEPSFDYDAINDGSKDAYIASFAKGAKAYANNHSVILLPFSEPNLGEEIWGDTGDNTPAEFVAAWKRMHDIFVANGATNVKFGLALNNESTGPHKNFDDYYPGSGYVDYVGLDGFNFGSPWQTPSQVFSTAMAKVQSYGKPIYIFSMASASGTKKAEWISSFYAYAKTVPNLRGFIWFNENKEANWLINSDAASLAAFKAGI